MKDFNRPRRLAPAGFSLIEVVVATAVFATSIVAIIGLMSPLTHRVEDVIDSEVAARIARSIEDELTRLGHEAVSDLIVADEGVIYLYGAPDGMRVRRGPEPSDEEDNESDTYDVNRNLEEGDPPGIAKRDRYFLITVEDAQVGGQAYDPASSNSVPVRATVEWPYRIPQGPPSDEDQSGGDPHFDPSTMTAAQQRQRLAFFYAVVP